MSYTAIVLDSISHAQCCEAAADLGLLPKGWTVKAHHVTLAMGESPTATYGSARKLTVTHHGFLPGRVSAFRVKGAEDSKNRVPHITLAIANGAKPKESNEIVNWQPLAQPFEISGIVELCG